MPRFDSLSCPFCGGYTTNESWPFCYRCRTSMRRIDRKAPCGRRDGDSLDEATSPGELSPPTLDRAEPSHIAPR